MIDTYLREHGPFLLEVSQTDNKTMEIIIKVVEASGYSDVLTIILKDDISIDFNKVACRNVSLRIVPSKERET